jgi:alcohol dehydrogenase (NADP+)
VCVHPNSLLHRHEIAGKVLRVGSKVTDVKPGDRAGVGAQIFACLKDDCRYCSSNNENYCPHQVDTYNAGYPDGVNTMGGYSTAITANTRFVFPIPDAIESRDVCSMFCAGLTVYSPLVRNGITLAEGKGKKVGVVGLGGLGHYALMFAKALGAEVYLFSHSKSKEEDARKMGADHFIVTSDVSLSRCSYIHPSYSGSLNTIQPKFHEPYKGQLDLIISTRNAAEGYPLQEYLSMLWVQGNFVMVGLPEDVLPPVKPDIFMSNAGKMGASHIGSKKEVLEMLDLVAKKGIKPWFVVSSIRY